MTIDASDILSVTKSVTKEWTRQRKAEERGSRHAGRGMKSTTIVSTLPTSRTQFSRARTTMPPAAANSPSPSGSSITPAAKNSRKGRVGELTYDYFANTLLVQYMNRHPETASWKVTADPRGTLMIPERAFRGSHTMWDDRDRRTPASVGEPMGPSRLRDRNPETVPFASARSAVSGCLVHRKRRLRAAARRSTNRGAL